FRVQDHVHRVLALDHGLALDRDAVLGCVLLRQMAEERASHLRVFRGARLRVVLMPGNEQGHRSPFFGFVWCPARPSIRLSFSVIRSSATFRPQPKTLAVITSDSQ